MRSIKIQEARISRRCFISRLYLILDFSRSNYLKNKKSLKIQTRSKVIRV